MIEHKTSKWICPVTEQSNVVEIESTAGSSTTACYMAYIYTVSNKDNRYICSTKLI